MTEHSDLPRKSSAIVRTMFRGSSEIFVKWSEILRNLSKRLYYEQNYTLLLVDMVFNFISHSLAAPTREISS